MVVVDFIDMVSRMDKLAVLEHFELALEQDKAKPQIGQLSDLGLVELTRHRQGQSLSEIFTKKCDKCNGQGFVMEELKFQTSNAQGESRAKMNKIKGPFAANFTNEGKPNVSNGQNSQKFNKKDKRNRFNKDNKDKDFNKVQEEQESVVMQAQPATVEAEEIQNETIQQQLPPVESSLEAAPTVESSESAEVAVLQTAEEKPKKVSRKTKKSQKKEAQKAQADSAVVPQDAPADVQNAAETESQTQEEQETAPAKKRTVRRTRKAKNA